jgi:lipid-binding SYLF domain-containing protein
MQRILIALLAALVVGFAGAPAHASTTTDQRLAESQRVFESFWNLTEQSIPTYLLERAYGVVVFPRVIRAALMLGGRGGRGVMAVRHPDGSWSNPVFVTMGGANFGFQWGVQSTELVLVLMSRQSVEGIAGGKVTLGADASVAAGPIGRSAAAATDATFKAQVLGYARNEGLFAGVALDGSVIAIDDDANASAYGVSGILPSQILEGRVANPPPAAVEFTAALTRATKAVSAPGAKPPAAAKGPNEETKPKAEPAPTPAPASDAVKTFPMEDPAPGAPPPQ